MEKHEQWLFNAEGDLLLAKEVVGNPHEKVPLIIEYRYPSEDFDEPQIPLPGELHEAITGADEIFKFVVDMIDDAKKK